MGVRDWFGLSSSDDSTPATPAPAPKAAKPVRKPKHAAAPGMTNNSPTRHARTFTAKHSRD